MPNDYEHEALWNFQGLDELVGEVLDEIDSRPEKPELPTGITPLDECIWGLTRGGITVISARPGEGKTTLALQIANHLATIGKKALFVSLEMSKLQLVERLLVQETQISAWDVRTGKEKKAFIDKVFSIMGALEKRDLRIVDDMGRDMTEIKAMLREIVDKAGSAPDVIVVDFIQLIRSEGMAQRTEAIAEYLLELKEVAKKHNIAILVCSQLNRESGKNAKGKPKLANLKGSGSIEELADCVLMCWWEELGTEEKPEGFKYWIVVGKQRYGSPGDMVPVIFDKDKLTFHEAHEKITSWANGKSNDDMKIEQVINSKFPGTIVMKEHYRPGESQE